jgi:hypothetical protein
MIEKPKFFAEVILTFSNLLLSIFSLRLFPVGKDTLMQILTFPGCGTAKIELHLNLLRGGVVKGPATKPLWIQFAIESVTSSPYFSATFELGTMHGPKGFARWTDAPCCR